MILRETLKQEIDILNESQLSRIAEFIDSIKTQAQNRMKATPSGELTPAQRARDFREWAAELPQTGISLPNEAFDRESIYK